MNKNLSGLFRKLIPVICFFALFSSCKKTFDIEPEDALETKQMYRNVYDADAIVLGIYGKFMSLAKQYVLLNELRGDLLDVTANADAYLKELNTNNVSQGNIYADPRPFYEVIINCNDALKHFALMHDSHLLNDEQYYQRSTDIGILRSWLYLQLGIHFGSVPYVTEAVEDINDLNNTALFPKLSFDQLLDSLIQYTDQIPDKYLNQNTSSSSPTLIMAMDGYIVKDGVFKFFIHRKSLLGDINLWKGNYLKAATFYKAAMETATFLSTTSDYQIDLYDTYRISNDRTGKNTLLTNGTANPWANIFSNILYETETNRERMWTLPFDAAFAPSNPFVDLFSASRSYLVKPSALSIANWEKQERLDNGGLNDRRGINASYGGYTGQPEVLKYTRTYDATLPYKTTGVWILYRAATLHLRFAEAANRLGHNKLASVLINDGILTGYNGKTSEIAAPFDFDGTNGTTIKGNWYRSIGIRGRALNKNAVVDSARSFDMSVSPRVLVSQSNLTQDTEDLILNEAALETGFEGYRWPDLLRIALRREKESAGSGIRFMNERMAAKFANSTSGTPKAFTQVSDFYLPFKWN